MKNQKTNNAKILITIAGPTAVGKTDLTLQLAEKYNAHIFSADSRQLYKELSIGTAKPSIEDLNRITHHFINHISIEETFTAGDYEREFDLKITEYFKHHDIGILSGGTGLYLQAALEGLDDFPQVTEQTKSMIQDQLDQHGITFLQEQLSIKDPQYYKVVDISNARRLMRALSVIETSGKPYSNFLNNKKKKVRGYEVIKICLTRSREELYGRINARVDQMIENGLVNEVKEVSQFKHNRALQTVGYTEVFKFLEGIISLEKAIELIKRNSRRYAKRQMTWFNNQGKWNMFEASKFNDIVTYVHKTIVNSIEKE